jgi:hypothetical protein
VIAQLRSLPPTDPEEVVQAGKTIFAQQGWSVQGNVYQAARDIHLTIAQPGAKPEKSVVERWQTWLALFVGVLTITTLAVDLPAMIRKIFAPDGSTIQLIQQPLSGVIWDEGHKPLAGVEVVLPEFNIATTTDRNGAFAFQVKAHKQRTTALGPDIEQPYTGEIWYRWQTSCPSKRRMLICTSVRRSTRPGAIRQPSPEASGIHPVVPWRINGVFSLSTCSMSAEAGGFGTDGLSRRWRALCE